MIYTCILIDILLLLKMNTIFRLISVFLIVNYVVYMVFYKLLNITKH